MTAPRPVPMLAWPAAATLAMPGSKSSANRLLVAAAATGREVVVTGVTPSDDVRHLLAGLRTLGFAVAHASGRGEVVVGPRAAAAPTQGTIDCGNGGTTLRFLLSLAAITPGEWTLTGDEAMQRRPVGGLVDAWRRLGVDAIDTSGCPPVRVRGGSPAGGAVTIDASRSSQFVSSLLLVAPALPSGLALTFAGPVASVDYIGMTLDVLRRLGARAATTSTSITVQPGFSAATAQLQVDGDWSSMGVWTCLNAMTTSRIVAANLAPGSGQPDEALAGLLATMRAPGDHTIDVSALPDQFLDLAVVAAHRTGVTRLVGGRNLRHKESDRIAVVVRELVKLGVDVREHDDGITVRGGRPLRPAVIDPANDHRVAMAFALAGMLAGGIAIADAGCVDKSYPGFWRDLETVVASRRCVAVVGMRGAGKSTFARALAAQTGSRCCDTDDRFVAAHGPIAAFVAAHGWPAFRREEERLVADALQSGTIVSTGGGAIESEATRERLREHAIVVWLEADAALLRRRLAGTDRPSLTGQPVVEEIAAVLLRRNASYAALADVRLDAATPTAAQVDEAMRQLARGCRWPGTAGSA